MDIGKEGEVMAINKLEFTPSDGFLDTSAYPDPSTETQVRTQLMSLHEQTKSYLNGTVKSAIDLLQVAAGYADISSITDQLNAIQAEIETLYNTSTTPTSGLVPALDTRVTSLENAVTVEAATMAAANWDENDEYSFEDDYSSDEYDIEIALDADHTDGTEIAAWNAAQIIGSGTENKVKAFGTVPTSALHIVIRAVAK